MATYLIGHVKGAKGDKGDTGSAAGFGTPTASVDANVGTPSVTVTATGPDTSKVFDFAFHNMKGAKGDKGDKGDTGNTGTAAGFGTPTASVDSNTGTPSVSITSSGSDTSKVFDFQFHNLKGETGATGPTGPTGPADTTALNIVRSTSTDAYKTTKSYKVGDHVIYNNTLYKCTSACSAGSWATNSSHFQATTVTSAITDLNASLTWKKYANPSTGDTGSTGVSYLVLTGIPKGLYILYAQQNVHDNNAAAVTCITYINNVNQGQNMDFYAASGSWKMIPVTMMIEVQQDNSTVKVDFVKTVYQAFLRLYRIGI